MDSIQNSNPNVLFKKNSFQLPVCGILLNATVYIMPTSPEMKLAGSYKPQTNQGKFSTSDEHGGMLIESRVWNMEDICPEHTLGNYL